MAGIKPLYWNLTPPAKKGSGPICAKHPSGRSGKWGLTPFLPGVDEQDCPKSGWEITKYLLDAMLTRPPQKVTQDVRQVAGRTFKRVFIEVGEHILGLIVPLVEDDWDVAIQDHDAEDKFQTFREGIQVIWRLLGERILLVRLC